MIATRLAYCPPWCVTPHASLDGEESWVHESELVAVKGDVVARLCLSVDPQTDVVDGPYVLIGDTEYTLEDAARLGGVLTVLADVARSGSEAG